MDSDFSSIETSRLNLCSMDHCDLDGYTSLLMDATTHPFILDDGPVAPSDVSARIEKNRQVTTEGNSLYWTVRLKDPDEFIGFVALHAARTPSPVLSYAILRQRRRQRFATEAIQAVLHYAQQKMRKTSIIARTHLDNHASAALLESLAFERVGEVEWSDARRLEFVRHLVKQPGSR